MFQRWRRRVGWICVVAVLVVGWVWLNPWSRLERKLSKELTKYIKLSEASISTPTRSPAPQVEPKAIPILLKWLRQVEPWPRPQNELLSDLPFLEGIADVGAQVLRRLEVEDWLNGNYESKPDKQTLAFAGFELLGGRAAQALPTLAKMMEGPNFWAQREALVCIGNDALPTALELAASENANGRNAAAYVMGALGLAPELCVPWLDRLANDSDVDVRREALQALGEFPQQGDEQQLREALLNSEVADAAAYAWHQRGKRAIELYLDCLSHAERQTRRAGLAGLLFLLRDEDAEVSQFCRHDIYNYKRSKFFWIMRSTKSFSSVAESTDFRATLYSNFLATGEVKILETMRKELGWPK